MSRTTYYTATTLDGFIADPHDSLDWLFTLDIDADGPMGYPAFIAGIGAVLMGSTTYEWIRTHEATSPWPYEQPCWVFTHRDLPVVEGADVRFVRGDVAEAWPEVLVAAGAKGVWVVGGGDLASQVATAGLLDEVVVAVAPVVLGAGRPLFTRPVDLRLVELARNGDFACARYEVVGVRA
ncbi:hypothetical protein I601_1896 [Nocardioides dokdonensis FR1436]|uniref:Bacterial bifunctional deaminase-reductase C-terminal domain-containing protein n=1 Tax=Nocardioides dokdonensis FR1436 TaxID=1300347 RepID=A0A1A9GJS8_9ACTN|nr:dihydrofolate reductase family protein [Nocardioides dokdonensis]ANH38326.1 hypothetical protein I601_1896 [Nocardioides dokdonensis FR1436]